MNIKRTMVFIDAVAIATLTAAWFSYAGWPVLIVAAGLLVLAYVHKRLRDLGTPNDDEVMDAIAEAWSISDDGRPSHRLRMGTSDARGILSSLRLSGFEVVRVETPEPGIGDYPMEHYERALR